mgnify:CR=1 FL=1
MRCRNLLAAPVGAKLHARRDTPNFIFVLTDDQRHDAMGCAGNPLIRTPAIDALAARGIRFANAFVTLSICSPSRAACLTGRYGSATGVVTVPGTLRAEEVTVAHRLKEAGYRTGVVGKWHLGNSPQSLGFDYSPYFRSNGPYYDRKVIEDDGPALAKGYIEQYNADKAIDFLRQSTRNHSPFFLWLCTQVPHMNHKFDWPAREETLAACYRDKKMSLPETWRDNLESKPPYLRESRSRQQALKYGYDDPENIRLHLRKYYAAITEMDAQFGRVLDAVDKLGLLDDTYIVFMGDNGWFMGEHGFTSKVLAYEESIRVPMIVAGPGIKPAVETDIALNIDLPATILDLAGVPIPDGMHGRSLRPLLEGSRVDWRDGFLYEAPTSSLGSRPLFAFRTRRWKYIRTCPPQDISRTEFEELYDLQRDPHETTNLAPDPRFAEVLAELRKRLAAARHSITREA